MKILLVEDNGVDALLICHWLNEHDVTVASTAASAMSLLFMPFDLVLVDMNLPDSIPIDMESTTVTEVLASWGIPMIKISGHVRGTVVGKEKEAILEAIHHFTGEGCANVAQDKAEV